MYGYNGWTVFNDRVVFCNTTCRTNWQVDCNVPALSYCFFLDTLDVELCDFCGDEVAGQEEE